MTNERTPGLAGGRNSGILAGSGELVAFCDDDDEWLPTKVEKQVEALAGAVGAHGGDRHHRAVRRAGSDAACPAART